MGVGVFVGVSVGVGGGGVTDGVAVGVFVGVRVGVWVTVGVSVSVGVFVGVGGGGVTDGVAVGVCVGVCVGVWVMVGVGVSVGVWVGVGVRVGVGVTVGVSDGVDVGVMVGVGVNVDVGVDVGVIVGVAVGARTATVIVLLPETESSKRGAACTMPLKSARAVAMRTPLFTLMGQPIGANVLLVSEGDENPDATVIGAPRSGVPSAFGQKNVMLIVSASHAVVVGGLLLLFDIVRMYVSVEPFTMKPVGF